MIGDKLLFLPGNPRYQPAELKPYFGYDNLYCEVARVELATLDTLHEIGVIPAHEYGLIQPATIDQILAISTTDVDKIERITKHDIRAWVQLAQQIIGETLARYVHVPLTSYDPLDTGRILQFIKAYQYAIRPAIAQVVSIFAEITRKFARQLQIGRTHGQHALPITVGFWLATILSRLVYNWEKLEKHADSLVGKITGAVGACNAQVGLGFKGRCGKLSFEQRVLEKVGIKPARISTQILPPEPLAYFLFSSVMLSATLGQLGRDCRHLMRSEIGEIGEPFDPNQVGSSTMAQKRNPITFENLEGTWIKTKNEFGKVLDTLISEHQRDLVGSCVARDFPTILVNLQMQLNTLLKKDKETQTPFLERMQINPQACQRNFEMGSNVVLAEPLYIALQLAGYRGDGHHLVNHTAVPLALKKNILLVTALEEIASEDPELQEIVNAIPGEMIELFHNPQNYIGEAPQKANQIADYADEVLDKLAA
jgi:adenylosuccinate lyase